MEDEFSRRSFLRLMGASAIALAIPEVGLPRDKKHIASIALQLYTVRRELEKNLEATMRKISDIGFYGIETFPLPETVALQRASKAISSADLNVIAMHTEMPEEDKARENVLRQAEAYRCNRVVFAGWPEGEKYKDKDALKRTAESCNKAAAFLKKRGLRFGLHNHWWEFEERDGVFPFYYLLDLLDKDIFFEIDTYWVKTAGQDPVKVVGDFGKRAPLLHIKDGPAVKGDKANEQVPAGKGSLNFPKIQKAAGNSTEWMIIEFDEYAGDIFEGIKSSYSYLTKNKIAKGKF